MAKKLTLPEQFALNLRNLRAKKKMSQQDVAQAADISVSYVSMLERMARTPPLDMIEKIAKGLQVPPISLLAAPEVAV